MVAANEAALERLHDEFGDRVAFVTQYVIGAALASVVHGRIVRPGRPSPVFEIAREVGVARTSA